MFEQLSACVSIGVCALVFVIVDDKVKAKEMHRHTRTGPPDTTKRKTRTKILYRQTEMKREVSGVVNNLNETQTLKCMHTNALRRDVCVFCVLCAFGTGVQAVHSPATHTHICLLCV